MKGMAMTDTTKKLYIVTVEFEAYVLAENSTEAESFAREIIANEEPFIGVLPVTGDPPNPLRWPADCCVYHSEQDQKDITVADVLP